MGSFKIKSGVFGKACILVEIELKEFLNSPRITVSVFYILSLKALSSCSKSGPHKKGCFPQFSETLRNLSEHFEAICVYTPSEVNEQEVFFLPQKDLPVEEFAFLQILCHFVGVL